MRLKALIPFALAAACTLLLAGCGGRTGSSAPALPQGIPAASAAPTEPPAPAGSPAPTPAADPFADVPGYRQPEAARYAEYAALHPEFTAEQTVVYVNIGLDREFYTGVETVADPDSLLVLCNKYHQLPDGYEPADLTRISAGRSNGGKTLYLRAEAAAAFEALCEGAAAEGYTILGQSGYRSYAYQQQLYSNYAARDGQAAADTYSARPGFSEHQTGLAMDICNGALSYTEFGQTAEYAWAKENLHRYGFVLHYLPETQWITGYMTEEWHIRYVGEETAAEIYELGITFDEYCAAYLPG
ncbi:M15 family metallopeptidase [Anaerofilum sp. BX8]|uniref:M15 family metallopeptidase n=1 Tax=Anaerofilum hominis TaxID=2763016 RepID=A0A923IB19_9FIRM|nr:M15 family metallopeptidase [Anaerofilum hominis]MBC5581578.1 M15 family metallopeptidase [Anaerofilum hominis]